MLPRPLLLLNALEVEGGAPATAPHAIMLFDDFGKVRPGLFSEFPDLKSRHWLSLVLWAGRSLHSSDIRTLDALRQSSPVFGSLIES